MCGIVGYIGDRDITSVLVVGLERLSYRGYDSSGIAILSDGELSHWKKPGKIHELSRELNNLTIKGTLGIGHTRWATHGVPNELNAHPHLDGEGRIAVVHNGIIENYQEIKRDLINKGYLFKSETDTEVIVHLIDSYFDDCNKDVSKATKKALEELDGTFAIGVIAESAPEQIFVARKGSPLVIGVGKNENFISSDINAILSHTKDVIYLQDNQVATLTRQSVVIETLDGEVITPEIKTIKWDPIAAEKSGYEHYMLKEIYEQPSVVRTIISKYINSDFTINFKDLNRGNIDLSKVNRIIIQACGTSWHAGLIAKYMIEDYARVLTEVDISSEFRYRQMLMQDHDIVMAISQSGETADTLACIREAKSKFFNVLSFVNVKESTIDRESDGVIYTYAGQEVGVASTKNYLAQLICIYLFAIHLGEIKGRVTPEKRRELIEALNRLPGYVEKILKQADHIKSIAEKYRLSREFLFIGRQLNYPSALEGALKLKEISYIHATGYAAGELKHGPIALIDSKLPVVCVAPESATHDKMLSNIEEVKSRKGKIISIATEGDTEIEALSDDIITIPKAPEELSPMLTAIPLQLLSYYIAISLECDVDQPRNLAKSVTVE